MQPAADNRDGWTSNEDRQVGPGKVCQSQQTTVLGLGGSFDKWLDGRFFNVKRTMGTGVISIGT